MTRDEIVTALRCCEKCYIDECKSCPLCGAPAANLFEKQHSHIDALMQVNDSLKDAIARRDKQIEDMKQGMAQLAKAVAVKEENDGTPYDSNMKLAAISRGRTSGRS